MALIEHSTHRLSDATIGAAIEVHRHLGPGLLESSYQAGVCLSKGYTLDFLIEKTLVVEIKAVDRLLPIHSAQLLTYMRMQRVSSGLLINFNVQLLPHGIKRMLL